MRREEGFTLIELMVTLVIAGLLLGGVYSMMIRQQASYQTQDQVVEVQQNLRSSFILLRYDIRMTGFGLATGAASIASHLNNQAGLNGTDQVVLGFNSGSFSAVAPSGTSTAPIMSYPLSGATTIPMVSVAGFSTTTPYVVDIIDITNGTLIANATVTAVQASPPKLTLNPSCPNPPAPCNVAAGSYIGLTGQSVTYRVRITPPVNAADDCQHPPCLERVVGGVVSVLAEGVEDFQVAYGFDTTGPVPNQPDGIIDSWIYSAPGDVWPTDTSGLRAIRVSLLLRTMNRDPDYTEATTGVLEDHTWTSPSDGYRRRVIQFMENVRNLSL